MKKVYLLLITCLLFVGCSSEKPDIGKATNLRMSNDIDYVKTILKDNNLDNIDEFLKLVKEFNKEQDYGCGLVKTWSEIDKIKYNDASCMNRYEKNHNQMDADCRILAFTLIANQIEFSKRIKNEGTYLMFDIDVINNNKDFKYLKNKKEQFITLFNEINVDNKDIKQAFIDKWNEYQIKLNNDNVKLISVVIHDKESKVVFVGHTGILINLNDKLMFVEKIAFEQPYQITLLKNKEQLYKMLSKREGYFADDEETFIYENDMLIYTH